MPKIFDAVREITTTTGTGPVTLDGPATGFTSFDSHDDLSDGDEIYYVIEEGFDREIGQGVWGAGNTLSRATVSSTLISGVFNDTNPTALTLSGAAVVFSARTAEHNDLDKMSMAIGNISSPLCHLPLKNSLDFKGVGALTYTNSSSKKTHIDRYGKLQYTSADEPRFQRDGVLLEGSSTNLIVYSNLISRWLAVTAATANSYSVGQGLSSGLGNCNLLESISTGAVGRRTEVTVTTASDSGWVLSALCKDYDGTDFRLGAANGELQTAGINCSLTFAFATENLTITTADATRTPFGGFLKLNNGWYKVWVGDTGANSLGVSAGAQNIDIGMTGATVGSKVYCAVAQFEELPLASSYIPSTDTFTSRATTGTYYDILGVLQTAAIDVARYSYNPADLTAPSYLILEEASTNFAPNSEDLALSYSGVNNTVLHDVAIAPDGTMTADIMVTTTTGYSDRRRNFSALVPDATEVCTHSIYAKADTDTFLQMVVRETSNASNQYNAEFDLSTGLLVATSAGGNAADSSHSIQNVGNGWYRCSVSARFTSTAITCILINRTLSGVNSSDIGNGLFTWGLQLEEDGYPTSYISSSGAATTRSADISSSAVTTRIADRLLLDASENTPSGHDPSTYIFDVKLPEAVLGVDQYLVYCNMLSIVLRSTGDIRCVYATKTMDITAPTLGDTYRLAFTFDGINTGKLYSDGGFKASATSIDTSALVDDLSGLALGYVPGADRPAYLNVSIVGVYDFEMTAQEVALA